MLKKMNNIIKQSTVWTNQAHLMYILFPLFASGLLVDKSLLYT